MKKIKLFAMVLTLFGNVCFAAGNFSLSGDELDYDMESSLGIARGNVVLQQDGGVATGDYAQFNDKEKKGYMSGNVRAEKDGYVITANSLTVHSEDHISANGNAIIQHEGRTLKAPIIDYYKSKQFLQTGNGRAILIDTDGSTLEADKIDYDKLSGVANAEGDVRIKSNSRNLTAKADTAIYRIGDENQGNYLELIGNAEATQDGNTVRGKHLKLNNARVASADGGVSIDFIPKQQKTSADKRVG